MTLMRPEYPLIRFGTGDLSAWTSGPEGSARLVGVLGRVGEAVKVKGMFLHPRQAASVMQGLPRVSAWRFVVDRVEHKDELACEVVLRNGQGAQQDSEVAEVIEQVRGGGAVGAPVRCGCPRGRLGARGGPGQDRRRPHVGVSCRGTSCTLDEKPARRHTATHP